MSRRREEQLGMLSSGILKSGFEMMREEGYKISDSYYEPSKPVRPGRDLPGEGFLKKDAPPILSP